MVTAIITQAGISGIDEAGRSENEKAPEERAFSLLISETITS
jgi:hypothetical protein